MTSVVRSPLFRRIAFVSTLAVIAILYFALLKPNNNKTNKDSKGAVPAGVTNLVDCIAKAGTDTGKIEACKAKFQ